MKNSLSLNALPWLGTLLLATLLGLAGCKDGGSQSQAGTGEAKGTEINYALFGIDPAKVTHTISGLQIYIKSKPEGDSVRMPQAGQLVTAHYHGQLLDGQVFDSSVQRGQPYKFVLGQGRVIQGWDEAFAQMPIGTKAVLIIPPSLGYGDSDMGTIPPNSTLVFDVELIDAEVPAQ
jgi:FKBP-type peptidyl-prolyl cis-trans isomerase